MKKTKKTRIYFIGTIIFATVIIGVGAYKNVTGAEEAIEGEVLDAETSSSTEATVLEEPSAPLAEESVLPAEEPAEPAVTSPETVVEEVVQANEEVVVETEQIEEVSTLSDAEKEDLDNIASDVFYPPAIPVVWGDALPTISKKNVPTNTLSDGEMSLLRFTVKANSFGNIGITKFTLKFDVAKANLSDINVYGYSDSAFKQPYGGNPGGKLMRTSTSIEQNNVVDVAIDSGFASILQVPAGETRYFEVRGIVSDSSEGSSVSTQLEGDEASASSETSNADAVESGSNNDFVWVPLGINGEGASRQNTNFKNGYNISGLPGTNLPAEVLSR